MSTTSFHDDDSESEEKVDVSSSSTTIEIDHAYKEGKEDIHVSSHGTRKSRNAFFFSKISQFFTIITHTQILTFEYNIWNLIASLKLRTKRSTTIVYTHTHTIF